MRYQMRASLIAASLMAFPATAPRADVVTQPAEAWHWQPSTELLVQGAGVLVGLGTFSLFIEPQAAVGGVAGFLGHRIMATAMAAAGAVAATYAYDLWTGVPIEYGYFWHRGGFVAGVAAGVAVFGVLGYPAYDGSTWLGWAANRAALMGTGLFGAWAVDHWQTDR